MNTERFERSYADFGVRRSVRQVRHALAGRNNVDEHVRLVIESMAMPEERIERRLGREVAGLRILEIGPGQSMERARYFGQRNDVVGIDLDIIPTAFDPRQYWQMARANGLGRVVKTAGRHLLIGRAMDASYRRAFDGDGKLPELRSGDIETEALEPASFDVVMSWSVFEHIADPKRALENVVSALRPGGVLHISIHLWTAHDGHHDIRAFTGGGADLPTWGHLRPARRHEINPSSYLNEWRIDQWRALFAEVTPGADEYLDGYEVPETHGPLLEGPLREELADYTDEELLTVNAVYVWRKPD